MDITTAVEAFDALSHETRLRVFRELVRAGPDGLSAGDIAEALAVIQNTMSSHLKILERAGIATSRRQGRQIIYRAEYSVVQALILFLLKDCCAGSRDLCDPIAASLAS